MSIAASRIRSAQNEMSRIQRKVADIARKEAQASQRIASATKRLSRTSCVSQTQHHQRDIQRCQDDLAKLAGQRAAESSNLARKQEELVRYQRQLLEEQSRETKRTQSLLAKFEQVSAAKQRHALEVVAHESMPSDGTRYTAFVSHALEDKAEIARPLAEALAKLGHRIWYDEFALKVGDSLRRSIDKGLSNSRFGIVVLSPEFFAKNWPQYELDGLVAKEMEGQKVILPLWHRVSKQDVMKYSPTLADRVALSTALFTIDELAEKIHEVLAEE